MDETLQRAMERAKEDHADSSLAHKAAFANSVQYLVTGFSGGFGGPSLREHLCSWKLAGENGQAGSVSIDGEAMTILYPDGSLHSAGEWEFDKAMIFCEPLCFNPASEYRNVLIQILEREYCFDDDPQDLIDLRGKVCLACGKKLAKQARGDYCDRHRHKSPSQKAAVKRAKNQNKTE